MGPAGAEPVHKLLLNIDLLHFKRDPATPARLHQVSKTENRGPESLAKTEFNMRASHPRSRKISVRLSEEEYFSLRRLCFATAARNVSDLTRRAVRELLARGAAAGFVPSSFKVEFLSGAA